MSYPNAKEAEAFSESARVREARRLALQERQVLALEAIAKQFAELLDLAKRADEKSI